MCLITEQKEPRILMKDKKVWKIMRQTGESEWRSPYSGCYWRPNVMCETTIRKVDVCDVQAFDGVAVRAYRPILIYEPHIRAIRPGLNCYGQGFHAAKTKKRLSGLLTGVHIMPFLIPAGAEVYEDKTWLIVANKMMML